MSKVDLTKTNHANLINAYINKRGITRKEFAKRCGIYSSKISAVLLGQERLTPEQEKLVLDMLASGR